MVLFASRISDDAIPAIECVISELLVAWTIVDNSFCIGLSLMMIGDVVAQMAEQFDLVRR